MTLQAIADVLNADGVPTLRGGTQWRPSSVQAAAGYRRPAARSGGILLPRLLRPLVEIRLTEVIQGLSYALDLTEGEPAGHAARSCLIGMRLADELGIEQASDRSDLFYALLLKDAGCSANAARLAALFGADDHEAKHSSKRIDWARSWPAFVWAARTAAPGQSLAGRTRRLLAVRDEGEVTRSLMQARCERGAEIARMLGLSEATAQAIYALDEHWDGAGHPHGLRGDEIPLGARIGCLAQTLEIFWATRRRSGRLRGGRAAPRRMVRSCAGRRARRRSRRRELLGLAPDRGSQPNRARGPTTPGRQSATGPNRRCVRRRHRRQVALDLPALRPHQHDRYQHRGRARCRPGDAARPEARRPPA